MRRAVLSVIALVSFCAAGWAADAVDDIITLAQRGIGDEVLLAKVETGSNPALSTQDILRLKDGRVSDRVIAAMIRRGSYAPATSRVDYTASKYATDVSDPVIGAPERLTTAPVTRERIIEVQRTVPVYSSTYSTPVVYSTPAVYSSPVIYAGYSSPYYGGYYGRPYYSSYSYPRYYGGYYGRGYYGHGHYHRGHYHGGGGFGFRAGFRF